MSGRSYLSIGDVLGLLRQEFPDVTISKIRFLESQGLVNPERTPSGYRKFYEQDVERLRWVLRQQREHFLPLKVIKGRLEQDGEDDGEGAAPEEVAAQPVGGAAGRPAHALATSGAPTRIESENGGEAAPRRPAGPAPSTPARVTVPAAGREPVGVGTRAAAHAVQAPAAVTAPGGSAGSAGSAAPASSTATAARSAPGAASSPAGAQPPAQRAVAAARPAAPARPAPDPAAEAAAMETLSGDAMTAEELAAASGLDAAAVAQLDSYGLVSGRVVGGVTYYERDALDVARLAAGFARYGVEARHLRLHKHAAEREAGFIEQIVLPVLKQRNPEARRRALDTVAELSRLGLGLREVLLRNTLRDQLGG